jgi:hypothetical protein
MNAVENFETIPPQREWLVFNTLRKNHSDRRGIASENRNNQGVKFLKSDAVEPLWNAG